MPHVQIEITEADAQILADFPDSQDGTRQTRAEDDVELMRRLGLSNQNFWASTARLRAAVFPQRVETRHRRLPAGTAFLRQHFPHLLPPTEADLRQLATDAAEVIASVGHWGVPGANSVVARARAWGLLPAGDQS